MDGISAPRLAAGNTDPKVSVCGLNEVLGLCVLPEWEKHPLPCR